MAVASRQTAVASSQLRRSFKRAWDRRACRAKCCVHSPAGQCCRASSIERAWREATSPQDREHVTPFIWRQKDLFRTGQLTSPVDYSQLRWTVDNEADFELIAQIYEALYRPDRVFGMEDVLQFLAAHPEL